MVSSQNFLPIEDIKNNLVFLKDGGVSMVITTSAVNFSLLFETEQISLIEAFAGLLNSLSFPIQIVIHSKRLDVSSYLNTLDQAYARQTNTLLKNMTIHYKSFVDGLIKEKNVLDKQFYICLTISSVELGVLPKKDQDKAAKATTLLTPRRDHILRQLARLGLKSRQLNNIELVKLFYEFYNAEEVEGVPISTPATLAPAPIRPGPTLTRLPNTIPFTQPRTAPVAPTPQHTPSYPPLVAHLSPPFVVEELADDFGP